MIAQDIQQFFNAAFNIDGSSKVNRDDILFENTIDLIGTETLARLEVMK
jgi:hypothetical protein